MCLLIVVSNISIFDWNIGYSAWGIWKLLQNNFHFPQILLNHKADKSVYLNGMTRKSVDECKIDILSEKYFFKIKIIDTLKHLWIQTHVKGMCILLFTLKITGSQISSSHSPILYVFDVWLECQFLISNYHFLLSFSQTSQI